MLHSGSTGWCPEATHYAIDGRVEVLADAHTVAGSGLSHGYTGSGDHPVMS